MTIANAHTPRMSRGALLVGLSLLLLVGGCASRFDGEWLEEGIVDASGKLTPADPARRTALRFDPPCTLRYGSYADRAGVVDAETEQFDTYWIMQDGHVAQAGEMSARVAGDHLTAVVGDDTTRRFIRVRGKSIFPPALKLPSLSSAAPRKDREFQSAIASQANQPLACDFASP